MHTRDDLTTADFTVTIEGRPAGFAELLPRSTLDSRVAIVACTPGGAFGGAATLLGLVTQWYAERARTGEDFFEYPDFFYLEAGRGGRANLNKLEIWPPHKQVAVGGRTQGLLEAIADRAIDFLLIEDHEPGRALVRPETRNALPRHLRGALADGAGGAGGVAADADVAVESSVAAERHVTRAIDSSGELAQGVRDSSRRLRSDLLRDGRVTERLRRVSLQEAVGLLCLDSAGPPSVSNVVCAGDTLRTRYALANCSTASMHVAAFLWFSKDEQWDEADTESTSTNFMDLDKATSGLAKTTWAVPDLDPDVKYHAVIRLISEHLDLPTGAADARSVRTDTIPLRGVVTAGSSAYCDSRA